ncbi:alpha/beta fold hydrolase [Rhizobium sp. L1K21]|uniref:alpha/beta fold hydrolase n=1 Tax=Rhizobium sp. L1K21 TaxID=2954933 RepID=UPI0020927FC2|nr:alpha/beta hydrolase [Rhizobium sp. L1K21]MCO6186338.1 alpha/beta hydrolase [Rhizobium sp. L1K21]
MSRRLTRFIGKLINAVGWVSPTFGGRMAFYLFSRTATRTPKSDKEKAVIAAAIPVFAQAQTRTVVLSEGKAVAHVFPAKAANGGPRVLLTHGWNSSALYMVGMIEGLRSAGAEVVALDLPGHGASPGRRLHAALAVEAISKTCEQLGPFDLMVGHSFGGYMTVASVRGVLQGLYKPQPRKVVTIASPSDVRIVFGRYVKMLGLSKSVHNGLISRIEAISGRKVEDFFGPKMLSEAGVEALVLHAEDDKEVDANAARQYADAGPQVQLQWLNGLGHRRIVNSPEAIVAVTSFAA